MRNTTITYTYTPIHTRPPPHVLFPKPKPAAHPDLLNLHARQYATNWVPIQPVDRGKMECIPGFDDEGDGDGDGDGNGNGEGFWREFGNKLRVSGTEERVWRVGKWLNK